MGAVAVIHKVFASGEGMCNYEISFNLMGVDIFVLFLIWILMLITALRKGFPWGYILFLTGGWVNLMDRVRMGCVMDYWNVPLLGVKNNINDWVVFVGIILIVREHLWKKK